MRPLKLLTVGHSYVVGLNRRLAHELARCGKNRWEVKCVAPAYFHGGRDLAPVVFRAERDEPCPVEPVATRCSRWIHVFWYERTLARLLNQGWDVVHAWEEPYILAGFQIAALTPPRSRLVFRTAQSQPKSYPLPFSKFEQFAMRRASGWVCSGTTVERNLISRKGYSLPHLKSPLGVDTSLFYPNDVARKAALGELDWQESGPPVIGYVGRFARAKGIPLLLEALSALKTPHRVLFLGAGELEPELRAFAARHAGAVRVLHVPHDRVFAFLNVMDVLCAPSQTTPAWKEQFGRMLVEAMACGVPVLGSDSGEIPYVVGDAGVVLPEADAGAWTTALSTLLESGGRRRALGQAGLDRARSLFAWQRVAEQYLEFFSGIAS